MYAFGSFWVNHEHLLVRPKFWQFIADWPPLTTNILLNRSLFLVQQYYWALVFTIKKKYITKAAKHAKHSEFNLIWAKKGHGKFLGSFSYQLITLIILMLWRKGNMILKVDRQGFLLVPKSGPKLINMMEILLFKTYSHFRSRILYYSHCIWRTTFQGSLATWQRDPWTA